MAIWAVDLDVSNTLISVLNMVVGLADVVAYISGGGATGLICHLYFGIDGVRRRFLGSITVRVKFTVRVKLKRKYRKEEEEEDEKFCYSLLGNYSTSMNVRR